MHTCTLNHLMAATNERQRGEVLGPHNTVYSGFTENKRDVALQKAQLWVTFLVTLQCNLFYWYYWYKDLYHIYIENFNTTRPNSNQRLYLTNTLPINNVSTEPAKIFRVYVLILCIDLVAANFVVGAACGNSLNNFIELPYVTGDDTIFRDVVWWWSILTFNSNCCDLIFIVLSLFIVFCNA